MRNKTPKQPKSASGAVISPHPGNGAERIEDKILRQNLKHTLQNTSIAHGGDREAKGFAPEPTGRDCPPALAPRPRRPKCAAFGIAVSDIAGAAKLRLGPTGPRAGQARPRGGPSAARNSRERKEPRCGIPIPYPYCPSPYCSFSRLPRP